MARTPAATPPPAPAAPAAADPADATTATPVRLIAPADLDVVGFRHVKAGGVYEVPAAMAGTAPDPRYAAAAEELAAATAAIDHKTAQARREELIDLHDRQGYGTGLLAQGWQPAPAGASLQDDIDSKAAAKAAKAEDSTPEGDAT